MKTSSRRCLSDKWSWVSKYVGAMHTCPTTQHYREMEIDLFKTHFGDIQGKQLLKLDLWNEANSTEILVWAAQQGAEVYGLDIAKYTVEAARKTFDKYGLKADLIQSDICNIRYPSNKFDFVYTMGTIEHNFGYEKALREIRRVLKPGGKAIIGVPNRWHPFLRPVLVWILTLFNKYPYAPEINFSRRQIKRIIEKNGLRVTDETGILFLPTLLRMADIFFYKKARFLCNVTKVILAPFKALEKKKMFKRHGYVIACVCEKAK